MESIITQTLISIQGEGIGIGRPILLIRFNGCNLNCSFCDTSWTNEKTNCQEFDKIKNSTTPFIVNENNIYKYIEYISEKLLKNRNIRTVLFTGGEPFLNIPFMKLFINITTELGLFNLFEIETNGTMFDRNFDFIYDYKKYIQLNISPKVHEYKKLYNGVFETIVNVIEDEISTAIANCIYNPITNSNIKFVYSKEFEKEIDCFIKEFNMCIIPMIMSPLTPSYDIPDFNNVYRQNCLDTIDYCLRTGYKYTPRDHIFLFGKQREEFKSLKD